MEGKTDGSDLRQISRREMMNHSWISGGHFFAELRPIIVVSRDGRLQFHQSDGYLRISEVSSAWLFLD